MADAEVISAPGAANGVPSVQSIERFILRAFPMGHFANDWPDATIYILLPAIALTLGLSPAEVGLLIAIHSGGASLGFLPAGLVADSVSKRGVLLALTFWWVAIGYLCASFAPNFWLLALLFCLAGLGDSAWHPIATGVMVEQMPNRRAKVLGIHAIGGTLASVGAPLFAGFLLTMLDWRMVLQLSVVPTIIMGVVFTKRIHWIPDRQGHGLNRADLKSMVSIWLGPRGLRTIGIVVLYNMSMMAILSMLALFVQNLHGFSTAQTGMLFGAFWLLSAALQPLLGNLSDIVGRKRVAASGLLIGAVLIALLVTVTKPVWLIILVILGAGTLGGIRAVLLASMVDVTGQRQSTTLGFAFAVMDGVGALGAVIAGALGSMDLRYAFLFSAAVALAAMLLTLIHRFGPAPAQHAG